MNIYIRSNLFSGGNAFCYCKSVCKFDSLKFKTPIFIVFLICLTCCSTATDINAKILEGGVQVSETLPAVAEQLRSGTTFSEANLPPMGTTQSWRWIPAWSAGTWHREMQTTFLPIGPVTTLNRTMNESQRGEQIDSNGGIWMHISLPEKTTTELSKYIDFNIINDSEAIVTNQTQTVTRRRATTIEVKTSSNKIARVLQKEEFATQRPESPGVIFQDGSLTVYNEQGKQLTSQHIQCRYYLIRRFVPVNIDPQTGLDLHQDFKDYLMARGFANLVPLN